MENLKNKMNRYLGQEIPLAIFDDYENPDDFYVGFLLALDSEFVLINAIDKYGEEDGFRAIAVDDIFSIQEYTLYINRLMRLFHLKNQHRVEIAAGSENALHNLLQHAKSKQLSIEINGDENQMGYVTDFDRDTLTIHATNHYCDDLGLSYFTINNIHLITCSRKALRDVDLLHMHEKNKG